MCAYLIFSFWEFETIDDDNMVKRETLQSNSYFEIDGVIRETGANFLPKRIIII